MIPSVFWLVPIGSLLALAFAFYFFKKMMQADEGTDKNENYCSACADWSYGLSETAV
jgi:Na+/H+-translocating membrane pyrophosphatase